MKFIKQLHEIFLKIIDFCNTVMSSSLRDSTPREQDAGRDGTGNKPILSGGLPCLNI